MSKKCFKTMEIMDSGYCKVRYYFYRESLTDYEELNLLKATIDNLLKEHISWESCFTYPENTCICLNVYIPAEMAFETIAKKAKIKLSNYLDKNVFDKIEEIIDLFVNNKEWI